ncbi:PREDICTED: heavy metal-associated isoprenylated plant protein 3-like [Tarenaya hassleriana]|uniref:heavy metal-associated isoprenylated plant protein 3-like n=1 Tax=Tarenaya hassleriana TaxID=28532 RepID=UPI00053CAA3E|nr:PREDICTED: heavy metal-associated isoprenylated plant protein 3-like [Tarenaya hassleriana]
MAAKKVEIKIDINCQKCKTAVMETVTVLQGVNQVSLDVEKSLLTVVGTMDPLCVAGQLERIKQKPVIVTVGPPKPPEPKKEPENKTPPPPCCTTCDIVPFTPPDSGSGCTIV